MSALTPNQFTILEALKNGPRWTRSFQTVKPLLDDLIARELVERSRPHLGRGRNMVRLTVSGCEAIEIDPAMVPDVREEPKSNSKAFRPVLGAIKAGLSDKVRLTCERFVRGFADGKSSRELVAELAARDDVQRPAIWKRLRDGGVISPYARRQEGGKGRPRGGGEPGYTMRRRERSLQHSNESRCDPLFEQYVDRDPCPRCGVRGDIGCNHSRAPVGMQF